MGSGRLPGKCLAPLAEGVPVLSQFAGRWANSARQPTVVITTTTDPADDAIAAAASAANVVCSRGDPCNVVAQMDTALRRYAPRACYVARALADNPLVDVDLADWRLDKLREAGADGLWYGVEIDSARNVRGLHERITYAGTTDVWSRRCWDAIVEHSSGSQLEHPGSWWWSTIRPNKLKTRLLPLPAAEYVSASLDEPPLRTELDEPADLALFRAVWAAWYAAGHNSPLVDTLWALRWLHAHPEIAAGNAAVRLKTQSAVGERKTRKSKLCDDCRHELGSTWDVGLDLHCPRCGQPVTYFNQKPPRR
jgi:spore coat polysaccharide biosynthesis protein SpsF